MAKNKNLSIAFYERYLLTVEEVAVYFHIVYKKLRKMVKDYDGVKWILRNGNRIMIKSIFRNGWIIRVRFKGTEESFKEKGPAINVGLKLALLKL